MSGKPIDEAVRAFEEHFQASSEDPSMEGELEIWLTAWNAALAAAQQQGQAVAWADEWRAAVAAKLSSYGLSEEAAAVFASSELDEYKAGLCDCAENDPVDMVDLMMGVARDAIEKWKIESAGRPFGHKNTAPPPSAPVGVEGFEQWYARVDARFWNNWDACNAAFHAGKRAALAQQPAAVDEAAAIRAFEEHFQASSDDPYFEGELELWLTAWRKALAAQHQEPKS